MSENSRAKKLGLGFLGAILVLGAGYVMGPDPGGGGPQRLTPSMAYGPRERTETSASPMMARPIMTAMIQDNDFSKISRNIVNGLSLLPGLLTGISYLVGIMLGFQAIQKMRYHVEQPDKVPLRESVVRFAAGGALFALPIVFEAMHLTIGTTATDVAAAAVSQVAFNVQ